MLPASVQVKTLIDRTQTIRASLHEVEITLLIAILLVVAVMALFLRQLSATLIVSAVLGVSLIASFALMYVMGFSLNNLTLVAIVVAVGFVVDDAIVVVENIHRHLEAGDGMREAAIKGAGEIGFTVVSISFSLVGGVHSAAVHGGRGRTAVQGVRPDRHLDHHDFGGGVADAGANPGGAVHARAGASRPRQTGLRRTPAGAGTKKACAAPSPIRS